jgi:hypothetical protein
MNLRSTPPAPVEFRRDLDRRRIAKRRDQRIDLGVSDGQIRPGKT